MELERKSGRVSVKVFVTACNYIERFRVMYKTQDYSEFDKTYELLYSAIQRMVTKLLKYAIIYEEALALEKENISSEDFRRLILQLDERLDKIKKAKDLEFEVNGYSSGSSGGGDAD